MKVKPLLLTRIFWPVCEAKKRAIDRLRLQLVNSSGQERVVIVKYIQGKKSTPAYAIRLGPFRAIDADLGVAIPAGAVIAARQISGSDVTVRCIQ